MTEVLITEGDALWSQTSYCIFCKEALVPDVETTKKCPLGHGYAFLYDEDQGESIHILLEPAFLVIRRERPSPWGLPEGLFEDKGVTTEQDMLYRLLSHCFLCGESLILDPDIPEVKMCPAAHGIVYVYEQDYSQQVVAFEPSLRLVDEEL